VQTHRSELEAAGWRVEILPDLDHAGAVMSADAVIDRVDPFLDMLTRTPG